MKLISQTKAGAEMMVSLEGSEILLRLPIANLVLIAYLIIIRYLGVVLCLK